MEKTPASESSIEPLQSESDDVIRIENLRKWYPLKRGFFETLVSRKELSVKAVDGVSFSLRKGEIFALAGESGSGKTTLGKVILRLVSPTSGHIVFLGR